MHPVHDHHAGNVTLEELLPAVALLLCAGAYLLLARRARRRNRVQGWGRWRTVSFLAGLTLLAVALLPPIAPFAQEDFRGHMAQHTCSSACTLPWHSCSAPPPRCCCAPCRPPAVGS